MTAIAQRSVAVAVLLVCGIVSLPVAASFLDGQGTENFILPVQVAGMAVLGALIGHLLPGVGGAGSTTRRGATVGALVGVGMSVVGVLVFFVLLSGFDGA